ncbi:MAG: hypothetical protein K2V38_29300 [Gemmataceae bacterium]|nr:hypothetical protein [Gemmataceae bacterium]
MVGEKVIEVSVGLRLFEGTVHELSKAAEACGLTVGEYLSRMLDQTFDPVDPWDRLDPGAREAFEKNNISREDVNAAARGAKPLPKNDHDRRVAENYDAVTRYNAMPPTWINPLDICVHIDDSRFLFTVRQLLPKEDQERYLTYWFSQPDERLEACLKAQKELARELEHNQSGAAGSS